MKDGLTDQSGLALFDTSDGRAGIAWRGEKVVATSFPGGDAAGILERLKRRLPEAVETPPPPPIADIARRIAALIDGTPAAFDDVRLDLAGVSEFDARVFAETRRIARGATRTYGEIARALGDVRLAQRVGQALAANPFAPIIPCHRVLGADGRMTGFSAPGGIAAKERLLKREGALAPGLFDDIDRRA